MEGGYGGAGWNTKSVSGHGTQRARVMDERQASKRSLRRRAALSAAQSSGIEKHVQIAGSVIGNGKHSAITTGVGGEPAHKLSDDDLVEIQKFHAWIGTALPAARVVYHVGDLVNDAEHSKRICEVRKLMWDAKQRGEIYLLQRRTRSAKYEYIAVKAGDREK